MTGIRRITVGPNGVVILSGLRLRRATGRSCAPGDLGRGRADGRGGAAGRQRRPARAAALLRRGLAGIPAQVRAHAAEHDRLRMRADAGYFTGDLVTPPSPRDATSRSRRHRPLSARRSYQAIHEAAAKLGDSNKNNETAQSGDFGPNALSRVTGSTDSLLVELRGLEPLTPSMPWRCATSCATAPRCADPTRTSPAGPRSLANPAESAKSRPSAPFASRLQPCGSSASRTGSGSVWAL